jgi:hypothetical protein
VKPVGRLGKSRRGISRHRQSDEQGDLGEVFDHFAPSFVGCNRIVKCGFAVSRVSADCAILSPPPPRTQASDDFLSGEARQD